MKYDPSLLRDGYTAARLRWLMFAAADVIDDVGLAKNILVDQRGRVCLYGALRVAAGYKPDHFFAEGTPFQLITLALNKYLGIKGGEQGNIKWSNSPERTADEVSSTLRKAARLIFEKPSVQSLEREMGLMSHDHR